MRQDQLADIGGFRHRCGFAGGRVAGLGGAWRFFFRERCLVDVEIRIAGGFDRRVAGARVSGDDDAAARARGADQVGRIDRAAIAECDYAAAVQFTPERAFRDAACAREVGVETTEAQIFRDRVADGGASAVRGGEGADRVAVARDRRAGCDLARDRSAEAESFAGEGGCLLEEFRETGWPPDAEVAPCDPGAASCA